MNGDDLRDRRQGDPTRETARRYNLVNAAVRAHRANRINLNGQPDAFDSDPCDVPVKNTGTNTVDLFGVLGLSTPLIDPSIGTDHATAFQQQGLTFVGRAPTADDVGKFGVAQEAIPPGGIGTCRIAGCTKVQINVGSADDTTADITVGDTTALTSGEGAAAILWAPDGETGLQWAVVRLGGGAGLPPMQYPGETYVAKADLTVSAAFYPLHESNEGI